MSEPPSPSAPPSIVFGSHTDVGRRRENNEDSSRCGLLGAGALLVISDGVGGLKAGEVASRIAVDSMHALLGERLAAEAPPSDRRGWIDAAIRETDRRIRAAARQPGQSGMGATLSLLWLDGAHAWWGQAGDSRTYHFRKNVLRQISHDQSPVGRLHAEGKLTEEQARTHPFRHVIDQCLGGSGPPLDPQTGSLELAAGDVFLLCSDGLSDGLWDREIAEELKLAADGRAADETARALVTRANEASGNDNITAIVGRVDRVPEPPPPVTAPAPATGLMARLLSQLRIDGSPAYFPLAAVFSAVRV